MVVGAGYRVLPMVIPAAMPRGRLAIASAIVIQAGTLGLAAALLVRPALGAASSPCAILGGIGLFLSRVVFMLRNRRPPPAERPRPDWALAHALQSLAYLVVTGILGLALALLPASDATLAAHDGLRRVRADRLPVPAGRGSRGTPAAARGMAARLRGGRAYAAAALAAHRDASRDRTGHARAVDRRRSVPRDGRSPWIDPRGPRRERHCWRSASSRPPRRPFVRSPCSAGAPPARRNTDKIAGDEPGRRGTADGVPLPGTLGRGPPAPGRGGARADMGQGRRRLQRGRPLRFPGDGAVRPRQGREAPALGQGSDPGDLRSWRSGRRGRRLRRPAVSRDRGRPGAHHVPAGASAGPSSACWRQHPSLVRGLLSTFTRRIVELAQRIPEVAGARVETRFAHLFLKLADRIGRPRGAPSSFPWR